MAMTVEWFANDFLSKFCFLDQAAIDSNLDCYLMKIYSLRLVEILEYLRACNVELTAAQ